MDNIVLRNVVASDWAKLVRLIENLTHEKPPVALELEALRFRTEQWIESFPAEDQGIFIVAEDQIGDSIIGFCYLVKPKFRRSEAFIGIAIDKAYRVHQLGSQLFYRVAEWAVKGNIKYVIADVWDWNDKSIGFFKELGFKEIEHFDDKFRGETKGKIRLIKEI